MMNADLIFFFLINLIFANLVRRENNRTIGEEGRMLEPMLILEYLKALESVLTF